MGRASLVEKEREASREKKKLGISLSLVIKLTKNLEIKLKNKI